MVGQMQLIKYVHGLADAQAESPGESLTRLLLAGLGLFLAKFAKLILVGVAAAGGAVAKFFKGRNARNA